MSNNRYKSILKYQQNPTIKAQLYFIQSSILIFTKFPLAFQADEPLIDKLHHELHSLVVNLAGWFMKTDSIKSLSLDPSNGILDQDLLPTKEVNCYMKQSSWSPNSRKLISLTSRRVHNVIIRQLLGTS